MKISKRINQQTCYIHIADSKKGGNSSWAEKSNKCETSIRLAWYSEDGVFDPISSSELPMWGLINLMQVSAQEDLIEQEDIIAIMDDLLKSLDRQLKLNKYSN